jgi:hypothetical protein
MNQGNRRRIIALLTLTLPALVYIVLTQQAIIATGGDRLAGTIGVMLGLYVCSLAAADLMDLLFTRWPRRSKITDAQWFALNTAFLLLGITVIITGATRFTAIR